MYLQGHDTSFGPSVMDGLSSFNILAWSLIAQALCDVASNLPVRGRLTWSSSNRAPTEAN